MLKQLDIFHLKTSISMSLLREIWPRYKMETNGSRYKEATGLMH